MLFFYLIFIEFNCFSKHSIYSAFIFQFTLKSSFNFFCLLLLNMLKESLLIAYESYLLFIDKFRSFIRILLTEWLFDSLFFGLHLSLHYFLITWNKTLSHFIWYIRFLILKIFLFIYFVFVSRQHFLLIISHSSRI